MLVEDLPPLRRAMAKSRRDLRWGHELGWARVVEEHRLNPMERVGSALSRWRWRCGHEQVRSQTVAVLIFGVQRSGTNMLLRSLARSPEFEVHNENDRRAFERYRLRPVPAVQALLAASRHPFVLLKPLCDSHRADSLLDRLGHERAVRGIWMYRSLDGRVRSALARFGDANLSVLKAFDSEGHGDRWQLQRLSGDSLALLRSVDLRSLSAASGAALLWYLRNVLYFEMGLPARADVTLVSYDRLLSQPRRGMQDLAEFLGCDNHPRLAEGIAPRPPAWSAPLHFDPLILQRCRELEHRLDVACGTDGDRSELSAWRPRLS